MGTHARPRTRVRSVALGTLAFGATLTGVGLTAAALDPADVSLADGTIGTDPVDFTASGLGAPVPVADVSSLGSSANAVSSNSAGSSSMSPNNAAGPNTVGSNSAVGPYAAQRMALPPDAATIGQPKSAKSATTVPVSSTRSSTSSDSASPRIAAQDARSAAVSSGSGGTTPLTLPSVNTSLPINTALPVPSLPTVSSLSTTVNHTKSTMARLLDEVARLV